MTFQEGKGLVDEDHYAKSDIQKRIEELELSWEALMAASAEKKDRLQDAYQVCHCSILGQYLCQKICLPLSFLMLESSKSTCLKCMLISVFVTCLRSILTLVFLSGVS
jgi:hypothetical protein